MVNISEVRGEVVRSPHELPSSRETARPEGALATEGTQDRLGVE